ncbi:Intraflagellar transport protein 74 [Blattella germanica]|nr:Intraflagellar transport protein 74 [Blattella germanica]
MELEKPVTISSQDRPNTHRRREDRHFAVNSTRNNLIESEHQKGFKREDRPSSRRGILSRQSPLMEDRPYTQQNAHRPMTGNRIMRPPSATAFAARTAVMPGTASRLATAMMQQPANRVGTAMGIAGAQVNVVDRPITQQGLSGIRPGTRGPQMRQVQDKRYFEGLLQMKIRELSQEVTRLSREIDSQSREQSTFLVYDKRVKEMAAELTEKSDVDEECQELKIQNDQAMIQLEQLFSQRRQREIHIQQLEKEIEQEKNMTDNLLAAMSPPLRERYSELQQNNNDLQQQIETLQQELDTLTNKKTVLEDQLSLSQVKQEAVRLHHKLKEAEEKRESLIEEERTRATPAQEREQLLQRVKDDNAEMATMERQITEIRDHIHESQSERHQKYRELRKREETMEQFLSNFEENRDQEMNRIGQLESDIVAALQQISRNLAHSGHLPSVDDYTTMKDNLAFKEGELEKSKKTVEGLSKEQQQLQQNLQKVEALEEKIKIEMETLRKRMATMEGEMTTLSNLDSLRDQAQEKRDMLDEESQVLIKLKGPAQLALMEAQMKHEQLLKRLNENETYAQLSNLERKLAQLEQNNFAIQEFIASKKSETDYEPLKDKVYKLTQNYNSALKENLRKGGVV